MRGAQQHNLGIWETDGQVVAALADLGRLNPQPVGEKSRKAIRRICSRILKTCWSRWHQGSLREAEVCSRNKSDP